MKVVIVAIVVLGVAFFGGCGVPPASDKDDGKCLDYLEGRSKDPSYCLGS